MAEPKLIDVGEFRERGFLQEANRLFFHPLGLALQVRTMTDDWSDETIERSPWMRSRIEALAERLASRNLHFAQGHYEASDYRDFARELCRDIWPKGSQFIDGIWDYREDPEGIYFAAPLSEEAAELVAAERRSHTEARRRLFYGDVPLDARRRTVAGEPDVQPIHWRPDPEEG